jgi:hypothetical protein
MVPIKEKPTDLAGQWVFCNLFLEQDNSNLLAAGQKKKG